MSAAPLTFAEQLAAWRPFYATVATACATLIGLLFLALSLNLDRIHDEQGSDLMRQAQQSFGNLLYALAISLVFLVPFEAPIGLCIALLSLCAAGLVATFRVILSIRREGRSLRGQLAEVGLSLLVYVVLLVVSLMLLSGNTDSLYALVGVVAAMLIRPSRNAWNFLLRARVNTPRGRRK
jgi:hypothetical protein